MNLFDYDGPQADGPALASAVAPAWSLTEEDWEALRPFAAERRYAAGGAVLSPARPVADLHVVLDGVVDVGAGEATVRVGRSGAFGIIGFLTGEAQPLAATAREPAALMILPRAALEQIAPWNARLAMALLRDTACFAAQRMRAAGIIL